MKEEVYEEAGEVGEEDIDGELWTRDRPGGWRNGWHRDGSCGGSHTGVGGSWCKTLQEISGMERRDIRWIRRTQ